MWKGKIVSFLFLLLFCFQAANAEWVKQNTNSFAWFRDVFFLNENKGWIVGTDGTLVTTVDGGNTWVTTRKFTTDAILQVHFMDDNTGWMLCERNVYSRGNNPTSYLRKTVDGGKNWEKFEFENAGRERVTRLIFNKSGGAVAFGEGGIFYKLQEDGQTWKKSLTAIHYLLLGGSFADDSIGAIAGAGGTIMFTENLGLTWDKASLLGNTDTKFNSVFFSGPKAGWAVGSNGGIFHATGGGRLWRQQKSGTTANLNDVYFTSSSNGWIVGDEGTILRTRNGGASWSPVGSRITHKIERLVFVGSKGFAVGFGGTILKYDASYDSPQSDKPQLQKHD